MEQKYKPGDVVKTSRNEKAVILEFGHPSPNYYRVAYVDEREERWDITCLTLDQIKGPWIEPLRAEFEAVWKKDREGGCRYPEPVIAGSVNFDLFLGLRTKVTIVEIV